MLAREGRGAPKWSVLSMLAALGLVACPTHAPLGVRSEATSSSSEASVGSGGASGVGGAAGDTVGAGGSSPLAPECAATAWARALSVVGEQRVTKTVVAASGDVVLVGEFKGHIEVVPSATMPGEPLVFDSKNRDAFVARFDVCGELMWFVTSGGEGDELAADVTMLDEDVLVAVRYTKEVGFQSVLPNATLAPPGAWLRFDAEGALAAEGLVGAIGLEAMRVAASADGGFFVGGGLTGPLDVNDPGLDPKPKGKADAFLVKFDQGGVVEWARRWGTPSPESVTALAPVADGIWLAGTTTEPMAFGGTCSSFGSCGFLAKLDPFGEVLSAVNYAPMPLLPMSPVPTALHPRADGDVWITETVENSFNGDTFAGVHLWSSTTNTALVGLTFGAGDGKAQSVAGIVGSEASRYLVVGSAEGVITVGGETLELPSSDVVLFEVDLNGDLVNLKAYGSMTKDDFGDAVARGPFGEIVVAGRVEESTVIQDAVLTVDGPSIFVARLP